MIFDKIKAYTARNMRLYQPRAILSLQIELPGGQKRYRLLFTTTRMDAGPLKKFSPR